MTNPETTYPGYLILPDNKLTLDCRVAQVLAEDEDGHPRDIRIIKSGDTMTTEELADARLINDLL